MELTELQRNWNEFGKRDPFWAVLTDPRCRNNKWDPAVFFASGNDEVKFVLALLESAGLRVSRWRALDFGCAMGRLTQALCRQFHYCCGVDIAPSMIQLANEYNNFPERCNYYLNVRDDLTLFASESFDFVLTKLVLQHIRPPHNRKLISELVRVLDRGGALVFQAPSELPPDAQSLTAGLKALPDGAYRAAIRVSNPPLQIPAGYQHAMEVRVRNASGEIWNASGTASGRYFIQLGNHWRHEDGTIVTWDDGRTLLTTDLKPGDEAEMQLQITAPAWPGEYVIEIDLVEEGVAWFGEKGSKTYANRVRVKPSDRKPETQNAPVMEMHGVPREEVKELVEAAGGRVVKVLDDRSAGCWISYLYVVTKG